MKPSFDLRKATSAGLVSALAIASGTSAYGAIVNATPPPDSTLAPGGATLSINWDVNNDGVVDFTFRNRYPNTDPVGGNGVIWQENMSPATGTAATNGLISYDGAFVRYAFALTGATAIGPSSTTFSTQTAVTLGSRYAYGGAGYYYGGFAAGPNANNAVTPGTNAYVGFRFAAAGQTLYGWLLVNVSAGTIDFTSAAYQNTPNTAIAAGAAAVPEPSTLALLAVGAAGVLGAVAKKRRHA